MDISKKRLLITGIIFLAILIVVFSPIFPFSEGATSANFTVTLVIGNLIPNITWVEASVSANPNIGTYKQVFISFNATDPDGYQNLDNDTAKIVLTYLNEQTRISNFCRVNATSENTTQFNCSISLTYFDLDGGWTINASIFDFSSDFANNTDETFTYGTLIAVQLNKSSMAFSGNLGQKMLGSSDNPLVIDNVGNVNLTEINLTAYDLNKSTETVTADSFMTNVTSNATIRTLSNATAITIVGAAVPRDHPSFANNESMYLYVNISDSGLTAGTFSSLYNWMIDVE